MHRFRAAGLMWPTLAAIPALAVLIGLGVWQWQRMAWKNDLVARIAARAAEAPLDGAAARQLTCEAAEVTSCEYRRVRLYGRFDHAAERHVFAGVRAVDGRSSVGWWVFTPFRLASADAAVYVNRGFVPEALRDPARRPSAGPEGDVTIVAQVRTRETRGWFDSANDPARNVYYVRDPAEFGGAAAVASIGPDRAIGAPTRYLEVVAAPGQTGFPRPLAGTVALPNRHFEYALTWWGLALTLIGVYGSFAWTRLRMLG